VAAFVLFVAASLTDFLDGYLARAMKAQSNLGQMLDPIADKLLVVAAIAALLTAGQIGPWGFWAALIILCREIFVSGLREFLGSREVTVPVTWAAKIKTTIQMTAIAVLIVAPAFVGMGYTPALDIIGTALLWIAAGLTAYTGIIYLQASTDHLKD
jgi:cardiolipin synthase